MLVLHEMEVLGWLVIVVSECLEVARGKTLQFHYSRHSVGGGKFVPGSLWIGFSSCPAPVI